MKSAHKVIKPTPDPRVKEILQIIAKYVHVCYLENGINNNPVS